MQSLKKGLTKSRVFLSCCFFGLQLDLAYFQIFNGFKVIL